MVSTDSAKNKSLTGRSFLPNATNGSCLERNWWTKLLRNRWEENMQRRRRDIGTTNITVRPLWSMKRTVQTLIQCSGPWKKKIFLKKWNASRNNKKNIQSVGKNGHRWHLKKFPSSLYFWGILKRVRSNLKLRGLKPQVINTSKEIRQPQQSLEAEIKAKKQKRILTNIQPIPFLTYKLASHKSNTKKWKIIINDIK